MSLSALRTLLYSVTTVIGLGAVVAAFGARLRSPRFGYLRELAALLASASLTLLLFIPVMQIPQADLRVPFHYSGDAGFYGMITKSILDHGWFLENPDLGFPFEQQLYDFPLEFDHLHLGILKLLSLAFPAYAVVVNAFFILTFPLTTMATYLVLRALRISQLPALIFSIVYAFAPYHFYRGEAHLMLAAYYTVPISALLILWAIDGQFTAAKPSSSRHWTDVRPSRRGWIALALAVLIGSAGLYYAVFTIFLLTLATAIFHIPRRSWSSLLAAVIVSGAIGSTLVLNIAPSLAYQAKHGPNPATRRSPAESELFGLKIAQMILPVNEHRIGPLAKLRTEYNDVAGPTETGMPLGTLATAGFVVLLWIAASGFAQLDGLSALRRKLAAVTLTALLLGMLGGFSVVFSLLITPQIRAWNRISIFINFFALAAIASMFEQWKLRLEGTRRISLFIALLLFVGAFAIWDETSPHIVPDYASMNRTFESDRIFMERVSAILSKGSAIYQYPYHPFPETGSRGEMTDYDLFRGYLHSQGFKWSYGGMKGREADWQQYFSAQPIGTQIAALVAIDFDAVYIDRAAYVGDPGNPEGEIATLVGPPAVLSRNGRLVLFDLRPYASRLRSEVDEGRLQTLKGAVLHPVRQTWGSEVSSIRFDGNEAWRQAENRASLSLFNPLEVSRRLLLNFWVESENPNAARLLVNWASGSSVVDVTPQRSEVRLEIDIPPGSSVVVLEVDSTQTSARSARFRIGDFTLGDPVLANFK
jgi:hypothetical protein